MSRQLLMTPTMWNSIDWLEKCPPSWKGSAYKGLSNTLNRIWDPDTKSKAAIERGMKFEKDICDGRKCSYKIHPDAQDKYDKMFKLINSEGMLYQEKAKQIVTVPDSKGNLRDFLLYGKIDLYKEGNYPIWDIKTTGNFKGKNQYLSGWQHKIYCYCKQNPKFSYLSFIFDNKTETLVDVQEVTYIVEDFKKLEKDIFNKLNSVLEFLRADKDLEKAYMTKFNRY